MKVVPVTPVLKVLQFPTRASTDFNKICNCTQDTAPIDKINKECHHTNSTMQNSFLLGVNRWDVVNLRASMFVIGLFGIITIISYVNELAKAGLLTRGNHFYQPFKIHRSDRSLDGKEAFIQKDGKIHQVGLDLTKIHQFVHNKKRDTTKDKQIDFAVRLEKNNSYQKINNTGFSIYQHQNLFPNYYTTCTLSLNMTLSRLNEAPLTQGRSSSELTLLKGMQHVKNILQLEDLRRAKYRNATKVFFYQRIPLAYSLRDCMTSVAKDISLNMPSFSLNSATRKQWELWSAKKRSSFNYLFGSQSFGVCEDISRPCMYFCMLTHPLDRILILYHSCENNGSNTHCKFSNTKAMQNITISEFIKSQGNSLFQKLLYYSRHCRLVGDNEICVHDSQTTFLMTAKERGVLLDHVLKNLDNWFAVVGLQEYYDDSLLLFQALFGFSLKKCASTGNANQNYFESIVKSTGRKQWFGRYGIAKYKKMRQELLKDVDVQRWLHADLAIYSKFKEIFQRQMQKQQDITLIMERYRRLSIRIQHGKRSRKIIPKARDHRRSNNFAVGKSDMQNMNSASINKTGMPVNHTLFKDHSSGAKHHRKSASLHTIHTGNKQPRKPSHLNSLNELKNTTSHTRSKLPQRPNHQTMGKQLHFTTLRTENSVIHRPGHLNQRGKVKMLHHYHNQSTNNMNNATNIKRPGFNKTRVP